MMYKILLTIATGLLLFITYFHSISAITQDLGRHIKTGEHIVTTRTVPKINLYSYTYPDFPFINHHWGSEVAFYAMYYISGFQGAFFLTFASSLFAFGLVYFFAYKKSDPFALAIVAFLSLGILFERTDVRPEAFSYLFLALFVTILFRNREKPTKWLYALVPLQLLWVNTHVYFIIGTIIVGIFFLDALFTHFHKAKSSFPLQLLFVLIFCCLVTLINPNGLSGALYPFRVFENYGYQIEENQNIFFLWEYAQKRTIVFFWVSVVTLFLTLLLRAKHTRPIDWLLTITFTVLGIQAVRNMPLFVFATFIPFAYHLSPLVKVIHTKQKTSYVFLSCLFMFFAWQLFYVLSAKPIGIEVPRGASKAVDFLEGNRIKGPIFNNFDIGSYLIFRLYPKEKVFVDGRPEAYPASFFQDTYIPMQQDPKLFEKMDARYHFNTIFFAHTDQTSWAKQFIKESIKNPKLHVVYLDENIVILTKDASVKPLSLTTYPLSSSLSIYSLYQLFIFFQTIEQPEKQIEILQKILQKNPKDCTALSLLSQKQINAAAIYLSRYRAHCQ